MPIKFYIILKNEWLNGKIDYKYENEDRVTQFY